MLQNLFAMRCGVNVSHNHINLEGEGMGEGADKGELFFFWRRGSRRAVDVDRYIRNEAGVRGFTFMVFKSVTIILYFYMGPRDRGYKRS
jgi:hypothetical protein